MLLAGRVLRMSPNQVEANADQQARQIARTTY
jgi:hypothetical protein